MDGPGGTGPKVTGPKMTGPKVDGPEADAYATFLAGPVGTRRSCGRRPRILWISGL